MIRHVVRLKGRAIEQLQANPNIPEAIAAAAIKVVGAALSFAFSFIVARTIGPSGTGSFALAQTTAMVGATIALIGLDYVMLRDMAGNVRAGDTGAARGAARTAAKMVVISAILTGLLVAFGGAHALAATSGRGLDPRLLLLAGIAILPLAMNRVAITALRGAGGILTAQWFDGPQAMLLAVGVLVALILSGFTVDSFGVTLLFFAASTTTALAAGGFYARKSRHWPPATPTPALPMLRQSWRISFIVLSRMMVDWITLVSLSASHSIAETGIFRTAWQITSLIALIVVTFDTVSGPRIAAAHRVGDTLTIRKILRQSVLTMMVISSPLFFVILVFPEWLLGLFGPQFVAGATTLRILALGQLVNIVSGPVGAVLLMTGEERWSARASVISLGLLAIACFTIIPAYGLVGAAATISLLILFRTGFQSVIVRRQLRARP